MVTNTTLTRARITVCGIVQGVGFRPFVYNLSKEYNLNGWVLNCSEGVVIEVEGPKNKIEEFIINLKPKAPPLAVIENIQTTFLPSIGYSSFIIQTSQKQKDKFTLIPPDVSICSDCLRELFDPKDRRYRYPFINCLNCGPRFTIIKDIPYDRPNTTMEVFRMCRDCEEEYHNPDNRRFHAPLTACSACGPHLWLIKSNGDDLSDGQAAIMMARTLLKKGAIVAVKGIGGFHLACDATNDTAVALLRERKRRINKPFAIMSLSCSDVESYCYLSKTERLLLESSKRPIVLLRRKPDSPISPLVAPNNLYFGVMLPYTPLHYLLLEKRQDETDFLALVMTSGNLSEEPIAIGNNEALGRLGEVADAFLLHDRDIYIRCDDSVTRIFEDKEMIIRRSRGYAPLPVRLNCQMKQILACGADLKNTFCLAKDNYAFLSHHIGDMENLETLNSFESGIKHFKKLFGILPEVIAYDLHPEYLATRYALALKQNPGKGLKFIPVQHHHAHIVSCMAENGIEDQVIGVAFDGTGYGEDGQIWGGEFLVANFVNFKRCGYLKYVPLPGGEAAVKKPYRMAISYLHSLDTDLIRGLALFDRIDPKELKIVSRLVETRINSPLTSSCGRLFDAVSSLLGVCDVNTYEGQAAVELEMVADEAVEEAYCWPLFTDRWPLIIDQEPIFKNIINDLKGGVPTEIISAKFHNAVAKMICEVCCMIKDQYGLNKVVLSGGVFQNIYLLRRALEYLRCSGFEVYTHHQVPCNDGGIALGQAVIANAKVAT